MRRSRKAVGLFGSSVAFLKRNLVGLGGTIIAALGTRALVRGVTTQLEMVDALAKTSDKLGTTTKSLAGFQLAAKLTGVELTVANKALQQMLVNVSDAAEELGEAQKAFEDLRLDAKELIKLKPIPMLREIGNAAMGIGNTTKQLQVLSDILGLRGAGVINLLRLSNEEFAEVIRWAEKLGLAISRVDAKKIEQANDAFTLLGAGIQGAFRSLAVDLSPALTAFALTLTNTLMQSRNDITSLVKSLASPAAVITGLLFSALDIVGRIVSGFESIKLVILTTANAGVTAWTKLTDVLGRFPSLIGAAAKKANVELKLLGQAFSEEIDELELKLGNALLIDTSFRGLFDKFLEELADATEKMKEVIGRGLLPDVPELAGIGAAGSTGFGSIRAASLGNAKIGGFDLIERGRDKLDKERNDLLKKVVTNTAARSSSAGFSP